MAAPSAEAAAGARGRPPAVTPQQIRDLIGGGIAAEGAGHDGKDMSNWSESANGSSEMDALSLESASKEAYFSRVETFTPLKWAGKPHELSPLVCAKYGWVNVECDMLKCSSCQAFLCVSLQLAFDFNKYKERCVELKKALCTAHEKFCFWPDSPCPDRFAMLLVDEPRALLQDFLERFQSLCQLELQLPSLRPEDMKNMSLTEERISLLLQLIGEELEHKTEGEKPPVKFATETLQVQVPACVLALCGWTCSAGSGSVHLSVISCSRCMRKVGLWSFHQLECVGLELDSCSPSSAATERFPLLPPSPRRMLTRSQDMLPPGSEQDTSLRSFFDPSSQHRDWCPWVNAVDGGDILEDTTTHMEKEPVKAEPGWRVVLNMLLATRKCDRVPETEPVSLSEKSSKVFRIFRQWESMNSS
ncbi:nuclear-interacting partner of ALK isoform X2 [Strigops habroptila]|uniref:nuclear-interacting partner of ALK isoform X2 n=1 Tax=Strigops habroptila TaxID=2489341 RepID=UPI0011CFE68D|nr:nuclear-interacting partner of ALK isoform X2 [Strigops habroptila]